jgi:polyisoprenoid-binding protein YceI
MKTTLRVSGKTYLALLLLAGLATARAEDMIKYSGAPGSQVLIEGTSNIHDWTAKGPVIAGAMEVSPAFDKDLKTLSPLPKVAVNIPVRSLKSSSGAKMDEVMQDHMNFKQYKQIEYRLTGMTLKSEPKTPNGPAEFVSTGELTVSGAKQTVEMPVTIERVDGGKLRVKGSVPLKMTSFKINPPAPKLAMGLIKTGDDVKISIDWVLVKAAAPAEAAAK